MDLEAIIFSFQQNNLFTFQALGKDSLKWFLQGLVSYRNDGLG